MFIVLGRIKTDRSEMRYNRANLKKLESLCKALSYKVRYEQGHFQSGYCRVDDTKVLVINKFFDVEGRINCLLELLAELPVGDSELMDEEKILFEKAITMRSLQETLD